jgi:hypothetical protein
MLYILQVLDPIVEQGYNVVYFHTLVEGACVRASALCCWLTCQRSIWLAACWPPSIRLCNVSALLLLCARFVAQNKPPMTWLKQLYGIFNVRKPEKRHLRRPLSSLLPFHLVSSFCHLSAEAPRLSLLLVPPSIAQVQEEPQEALHCAPFYVD